MLPLSMATDIDDSDEDREDDESDIDEHDEHGRLLSNATKAISFSTSLVKSTTLLSSNPLLCLVLVTAGSLVIGITIAMTNTIVRRWKHTRNINEDGLTIDNQCIANFDVGGGTIPAAFIAKNIYNVATDFVNPRTGRSPSYWQCVPTDVDRTDHVPIVPNSNCDMAHIHDSTRNTHTPLKQPTVCNHKMIGPCFAPASTSVNWDRVITRMSGREAQFPSTAIKINSFLPLQKDTALVTEARQVAGMCRPGFIIIGAGKCGTSSLYHYLTSHPRVLPASEKQIHYFRVRFLVCSQTRVIHETHQFILCWHAFLTHFAPFSCP
jgi:hypothetical protein